MTERAFASFNGGQDPPLPLKEVGGFIVLETGEGPTLAFKDIGQQVVAQLLDHVLAKRDQRATILVETRQVPFAFLSWGFSTARNRCVNARRGAFLAQR